MPHFVRVPGTNSYALQDDDGSMIKGFDFFQHVAFRHDDETKLKFLDYLAEFGHIGQACKAAGIARKTAMEWKAKYSWFSEAWDEIWENMLDDLELTLYQVARNEKENGRARATAAIMMLNANRAGYKKSPGDNDQHVSINLIIGKRPEEKPVQIDTPSPRMLPPATGDINDADD